MMRITSRERITAYLFVYINFYNDSLFWLLDAIVPFILNQTVKTYQYRPIFAKISGKIK